MIDDAFQRALAILKVNLSLLDRSAKQLLAKETLSSEDLDGLKQAVVSGKQSPADTGLAIGLAAATRLPRGTVTPSDHPQSAET